MIEQEPRHHSLDGWDIRASATAPWVPWGANGDARARVVGEANGFTVVLVEAQAGYEGFPHVHEHPEFLYVVGGELRNQGVPMVAGDGYAAAVGSQHTDFAATSGATYLSIFRL